MASNDDGSSIRRFLRPRATSSEGLSWSPACNISGIHIFQHHQLIFSYVWSMIRKLCFKRKKFFLKLREDQINFDDGGEGSLRPGSSTSRKISKKKCKSSSSSPSIVEFYFETKKESKLFWKFCIEQHTLFRCSDDAIEQHQQPPIQPRPSSSVGASSSAVPSASQHFVYSNHNKLLETHHHRHQHHDHHSSVDDINSIPEIDNDRRSLANSVVTIGTFNTMTTNGNNNTQHHTSNNNTNPNNLNIPHPSSLSPARPPDILKEILMIERTFAKELDLICIWVHEFVESSSDLSSIANVPLSKYLSVVTSLADIHRNYLSNTEERVSLWCQEMVDIDEPMLSFEHYRMLTDTMLSCLQLYQSMTEILPSVYYAINTSIKSRPDFEKSFREFESANGCFLPFTSILIKPIFHARSLFPLFSRLADFVSTNDDEVECLEERLEAMDHFLHNTSEVQSVLLNSVYMIELSRDIVGIDNIAHPHRVVVRQGVMLKLSKKGYQQRMFFLFNDVLVYCSRSPSISLHFKIHGSLRLENVMIEEALTKMTGQFPFTIYAGDRALMVATTSELDRQTWIRDINSASLMSSVPTSCSDDTSSIFSDELMQKIDQTLRRKNSTSTTHLTTNDNNNSTSSKIESSSSPSHEHDEKEVDDDNENNNSSEHQDHESTTKSSHTTQNNSTTEPTEQSSKNQQLQFRTNTMAHVCWHRSISIGRNEYEIAFTTTLSGFLLRKFKSTTGWQKLWVVFSGFCLFFYKSFEDDFPLASLPLLGYSISLPTPEDNINKEFVFKLSFKSHVYYFRADNEYNFIRWTDVIRTVSVD